MRAEMHALQNLLVFVCGTSLVTGDPVIKIAMMESRQAIPFPVSSQNSSCELRFGMSLGKVVGGTDCSVTFQTPQRLNNLKELFGASSNGYPTSIQHKIPYLARDLGNTRYVTIAQDPTLVYPWEPTELSGQRNAYLPQDENTNSIHHGHHEVHLNGERGINRHGHQEQAQLKGPLRSYQQKSLYLQSPPHGQRPSQKSSTQDDPGRNENQQIYNSNRSRNYRLTPTQVPSPQECQTSGHIEVGHLHHHSRRRRHRYAFKSHRPLARPSATFENRPSTKTSRVVNDWLLSIRYGDKSGRKCERGCLPQSINYDAPHMAQQLQRTNQPLGPMKQSLQKQENLVSTKRRSGDQRAIRPFRGYTDELRPKHNDLPLLRGKWSNQPYHEPKSRAISKFQTIRDRPKWVLTDQSFYTPNFDDLRSRKVIKNFTMIGEKFDKHPHIADYQKPYRQFEYRFMDSPSFEHGYWFSSKQTRPHSILTQTRNPGSFYREFTSDMGERPPGYQRPSNQEMQGDDIEEANSSDENVDVEVGVAAIGDKTNWTSTRPLHSSNHKKNSSQDFLAGGELRFPDQNTEGLRELTELLKEIPENITALAYNHNGARRHLERTTKNIEVTGEMFTNRKCRKPDQRQQKTISGKNSAAEPEINPWNCLSQILQTNFLSTQTQRTVQPGEDAQRIQTHIFPKKYNKRLTPTRNVPSPRAQAHCSQDYNQQHLVNQVTPQLQYSQNPGVSSMKEVFKAERQACEPSGYKISPHVYTIKDKALGKRVREILTVRPLTVSSNDTKLTTVRHRSYSFEEGDYSNQERQSAYAKNCQHDQAKNKNYALSTTIYPNVQNSRSSIFPIVPTRATIGSFTVQTLLPLTTARTMVSSKRWYGQATTRDASKSQIAHPALTLPLAMPVAAQDVTGVNNHATNAAPKTLGQTKPCNKDYFYKKDTKLLNIGDQIFAQKTFSTSTKTVNSAHRVTLRPFKRLTINRMPFPTTPIPAITPPVLTRMIGRFRRKPASTLTTTNASMVNHTRLRSMNTYESSLRPVDFVRASKILDKFAKLPKNHQMEQRNQIVNIPQFRKRNNANDKLQESLQDPQQDKATEETSDDEMRIQFHLQGFSGPDTYRYGFHTADPYNPLERFEERDGEGHVRGHYSYVGPTGKRVTVNYAADQNGFRIVADESSGVGGKASGSSDNNQDEESDDGRSASGGSGGSSNNNEQDGSTAMGHSPDENYDSDNNRL